VAPQVWQRIEGKAGESHPTVGHAGFGEFGEDTGHLGVEPRHADTRVDLARGHPAAEQHPPPVRRSAVIVDQFAAVAEHPVARHHPIDLGLGQRLGGDHVAADGNHPAPLPRRQSAGIAVGCDHDFARLDGPAHGLQAEAAAVSWTRALDTGDRAAGRDLDPGRQGAVQKTLVVARGVERAVPRQHHAAVIEIGADFAVLFGPGHHVGPGLEPLGLRGERLGQFLVARRVVRAVKAADLFEVAVDALGRDERPDPLERVVALAQDAQRRLAPVPGRQDFIVRLDAGADLAAVAGAAAPAGVLGVQDQGMATPACGLDRRTQSGVTRPDDSNLGACRQGGLRQFGAWRPLPPVRRALVVGREQALVHDTPLDLADTESRR